jgi:hypothetical protein
MPRTSSRALLVKDCRSDWGNRLSSTTGRVLAATWPLAAGAQQPAKMHRIAVVRTSGSIADIAEAGDYPTFPALFKELRRLGYVERQNLIVERYSGEGQQVRYAELATEVVRTKPDLIVAVSSDMALTFKAATETIPVVGIMADPVAFGIVSSLRDRAATLPESAWTPALRSGLSVFKSCGKSFRLQPTWDTSIRAPAGTSLQDGLCGRRLGGLGFHCLAHRSTGSRIPARIRNNVA